jgi:malate dehydrogenase
MAEAIIRDQKKIRPVCAFLNGEYGYKDVYLGVPVVLGSSGIEKIIEIKLNADEKAMLQKSKEAVDSLIKIL